MCVAHVTQLVVLSSAACRRPLAERVPVLFVTSKIYIFCIENEPFTAFLQRHHDLFLRKIFYCVHADAAAVS